jgi:hypothetical protein
VRVDFRNDSSVSALHVGVESIQKPSAVAAVAISFYHFTPMYNIAGQASLRFVGNSKVHAKWRLTKRSSSQPTGVFTALGSASCRSQDPVNRYEAANPHIRLSLATEGLSRMAFLSKSHVEFRMILARMVCGEVVSG